MNKLNQASREPDKMLARDALTILKSAGGLLLTKRWLADGTIADYDSPKNFRVRERAVSSIVELSAILSKLELRPDHCIIRGGFVGEAEAQKIAPPELPGHYVRQNVLFSDRALHMMLIDADGFRTEKTGLDAVLEYTEAVLPPEFQGVSFHWQLSSSAGHPKNAGLLKAHIWFWLTTPRTCAELKAWAQHIGHQVDKSVYQQVQVHYTAAPVFEEGIADPIASERSGFCEGWFGDEVELVLPERALFLPAAVVGDPGKEYPDARAKPGLIGAFNRAYTMDETWEEFLPGQFERVAGSDRRVTWLGGNGAAEGCFVDPSDEWMVNTHNTSPWGSRAMCKWDLVRVQLFGDRDTAEVKADTFHVTALPSHQAMLDMASGLSRVAEELNLAIPDMQKFKNPVEGALDPVANSVSPYPPPFRGVMNEVVQVALAGSTKPQLDLCTLSALIGMAASCSGNYRLPSGMRLNLFGCGVAGTGEGKDRPRSIATSIVVAAKGKLIGKPASGPGLEDSLVSTTGSLIALDEIAHFFAAINNGKAPPYLIELAGTLLQLFSVSNGNYHTRVRAAARGIMPSRVIQNPMVSLLGFATPEKLGEAMGVSNIEDGLLGRFLFAFGQPSIEPRRVIGAFNLPELARSAAAALDQADKQASFTAGLQGDCDPIQIDPAAEKRLSELLVEFDQQCRTSQSAFAKALLTRSCEKCERIAGVLAVWDCPAKPVITLEHVTWATDLLHASDSALLRFSGEYMHGGQTQADGQRIVKLVQRTLAGEFKTQKSHEKCLLDRNVAPYSMVMRASKLDKRRFDDAVAYLVELFDLQSGSAQTTHPNGRAETVRWLSLRA